jgi:hypothetical protein
MPSAQVIDLNPNPRTETTSLEKTLSGFSKRNRENQVEQQETDALREIYSQYEADGRNLEKTIREIQMKPGISPTTRVKTVEQLLEFKKHNQALLKNAQKNMTPEQKEDRKTRLLEEGFNDNEAEEYLDATPGVQQIIWRQHNDLKSRGLRGNKPTAPDVASKVPPKNGVVGAVGQPPEGELPIDNSFSNEAEPIDEDAWPDIPAPPKMTPGEEVKWGNQNQKENNKLLAETRTKTNATRGIALRLNRLAQLSEKVPDDAGRIVIDPSTGEPYPTAQLAKMVNKETQDYVKTLNDFLIDAKAYFGSRVTNFDVSAFKARLPNLLNTADGRRLIIKQMELMNDLEHLHGTTLEDGLKTYGRKASYSDILSVVDNKVAGREAQIIEKINNLDTASRHMDTMAKNPEKFKETVLMQDPEGNFKAMPKAKVNQATSRGWSTY